MYIYKKTAWQIYFSPNTGCKCVPGEHSSPPFLLSDTPVRSEGQGYQWLSPRVSAAWVVQKSYSQVKLWPFNDSYHKGICWSLSFATNTFSCRGARSVFPHLDFSVWISQYSHITVDIYIYICVCVNVYIRAVRLNVNLWNYLNWNFNTF